MRSIIVRGSFHLDQSNVRCPRLLLLLLLLFLQPRGDFVPLAELQLLVAQLRGCCKLKGRGGQEKIVIKVYSYSKTISVRVGVDGGGYET